MSSDIYDATFDTSYKLVEQEFLKRKGILSPIRAATWVLSPCSDGNDALDLIKDALDIQRDSYETRKSFEKQLHRTKQETDIVGYFSACLNEDETDIIISFSMCSPSDRHKGYATESAFLAMSRAIAPGGLIGTFYNMTDPLVNVKHPDSLYNVEFDERCCDTNKVVMYQYFFTIREQFNYFIKRCEKYYKTKRGERYTK